MTFNQKVAILTGGSSGIGRASTVALAKEERTKVVVAACRENHNRKKHAGSQRTGS
jgi:NAD(P)-dependent dehydrogenase (short-subunit alcohol dehydrogenase family)